MVFPVVMYRCDSLTINKDEHQIIDVFELWCWRRLLRVSWTARRLNQSILRKINCEYSMEELMVKLKLQYFGHLMQRTDSLEKTWYWERSKARGEGDNRSRQLDGITDSIGMTLNKLGEIMKDRKVWCSVVLGVEISRTLLRDGTTTNPFYFNRSKLSLPNIF